MTKTRVTYGFKLELPESFTIRGLIRQKRNKIDYITLYKRVEKGLKEGTLVKAGLQKPKTNRKGRWETLYNRVNAKVAVIEVTASPASV